MSPELRRTFWQTAWRQLPFFGWLVLLWMLLWGQFTVLGFVTGVAVAVFVTQVFALPPVELSGRINFWYLFTFGVAFLFAVIQGSLVVAAQVLNFKRQPGTAVIRVPMRSGDDLITAHVGITSSLIPGSLVLQTDRDHHVLYLHAIGIRSENDVEKLRADILGWEKRIVRALGSSEQYRALKRREAEERSTHTEGSVA